MNKVDCQTDNAQMKIAQVDSAPIDNAQVSKTRRTFHHTWSAGLLTEPPGKMRLPVTTGDSASAVKKTRSPVGNDPSAAVIGVTRGSSCAV